MAHSNANPAVEAVPQDDIDAVVAAHNGTVVTTNTVVEDRTEKPEVAADIEYESESVELDGGTILTTHGEPVGGRPGKLEALEEGAAE
jgi:hypothetical protein